MNSSADREPTVEIFVNGNSMLVEEGMTLSDLVARLKLHGKAAAVELNFEVIPKSEYDHRVLDQDDRLEIVTLVGGG